MSASIYILGALTGLCCAVLLLRGYARAKKKLLLWSGLCFAGLTVSNALVFVDLVLFPDVNLYRLRLGTAAAAMILLLYGLIWESE
ncbi:MAG TPA: DUF5985 family protein [Terriglobia bacterium]|jgi:hypothetical protein